MKFNSKQFKNVARKIFSLGGYRIGYSSQKDWQIMVVSFCVVGLFLALLSGYMYIKVEEGSFFTIATKVAPGAPSFDKKRLNTMVGDYKKKEVEFQSHLNNRASYIDPSL